MILNPNEEATMNIVAGIDVSKAHVDVWVSAEQGRRFANTPAGLTALAAWLAHTGVPDVGCEPTGGYERALVRQVRGSAVAEHVVHPTWVSHFARAAGCPAKTDVLDAQMLAQYGTVFTVVRPVEKQADREILKEVRRKPLVDQRVQEHYRRG